MAFLLLCFTVFIMFFQPTYVFPVLEPYSPLKYSALVALAAYFFLSPDKKSPLPFWSNNVNRYFMMFVLMQFVSASRLWIVHGINIINFWLKYGIVYFLIIKLATTPEKVRGIVLAIIAGILYLSYFSLSKFVVDYEPGIRAGGFGWYENSNDLAVILVSIIPLSYMLFETATVFFNRIFYFILTCVFAFNILFTGSRNGLLGLFTAGMLSIILSNISRTLRLGLVIILCLAISGIGLYTVLARSDLSGLTGDASSEHRIEQWSACIRMIKAHPLLGVGPFESPGEMRNYGGIRGLPPHNTIIQVFAETGIPGGIFFVLFGLSPIATFLKNFKRYIAATNIEDIIYKYLCVSLCGYWVCAFFSNRVKGYQLYVLIALIVSTLNFIRINQIEKLTASTKTY